MSVPRHKSKKNKKRYSKQPSPERLQLSPPRSPSPMQPVAGPSRTPHRRVREEPAPHTSAAPETFTVDADFIAFVDSDDDRSKKPTREWDRGKPEWHRDRDRDGGGGDRDRDSREYGRDRKTTGRKRGWEESERDGASASWRQGASIADFKSREAPWTANVNWDRCRNVAEMMHKDVEAFVRYTSPTPIEHEVRCMIVKLIARAIEKSYPDAKVLPFGSFGTKLYLPQGDIDLVVQSQSMAYSDKVVILRSLANIVRRTGITDKVTVIAKARVPIIKFVTIYGRFSVDISMNQTNGVQAGAMINRFLDEFPALRAIVLVVKSFLNQRSLNEVYSGGLGSYAIVCLAVSFLQMHPKLRRAEIDPSRNLGVLVMEFFELYGKYLNYAETGISLRHGGTYFNKTHRGWQDYNKPHLLSIEDPGDISNDISRGSYGIKAVRQTFAGAFEIMKSAAYVCAGVLSARRNGRAVELQPRNASGRSAEASSILSSILGVSRETINHRRLVNEVYEEGVLAGLLGIDPRGGLEALLPSKKEVGETRKPPTDTLANRTRRAREAQSVAAAWEKADVVLDSDEEKKEAHSRNGRSSHRSTRDDVAESESESRYDMKRSRPEGPSRTQSQGGPARKRRRTDAAQDVHDAPPTTVFITDDDDEEEEEEEEEGWASRTEGSKYRDVIVSGLENSDDGLEEIERAYAAADRARGYGHDSVYSKGDKGKDAASQRQSSLNGDRRRAFWASKGMQGIDSDSP
ncbi:hypothetical protein M0805_005583 [Coniferiporia weirii]|nr:hypothetical protein M0805_005583 [Coniferiporia weirii]